MTSKMDAYNVTQEGNASVESTTWLPTDAVLEEYAMEYPVIANTVLAVLMMASEVLGDSSSTTPSAQPLILKKSICFEMLGCVETSKEWYSIDRSIYQDPFSRDKIGTIFKLYTRQNDANGEVLRVSNNRTIESRFFDRKKDTKFIIHGFKSSADVDWAMDMMKLLLKYMDINVITVDWSKGAAVDYLQATANTRVVGLEVANLVNALIRSKGASALKFHLIGHSLGAHTAGYAGEKIPGLGRITGLDPAGPFFKKLPAFARLDSSDAEFVDVIHTDAEDFGLGIEDISGHVDFFPNGGSRQPGAEIPGIPRSAVPDEIIKTKDLGSPHRRAIQLFLDSLNASTTLGGDQRDGGQVVSSCPLIGFLCDSYESFLDGNCTSCGEDGTKCASMGIHADSYPIRGRHSSEPRKFFLTTNSKSPFCGFHYAFTFKLANGSAGRDKVVGDLSVTVSGDEGVANDIPLTKREAREMKKGESYNFLGYSPLSAGNIMKAEVTWKWSAAILTEISCLLGCDRNLYISKLNITNYGYPSSNRPQRAAQLIDQGTVEIKDGKSSVFNFV